MNRERIKRAAGLVCQLEKFEALIKTGFIEQLYDRDGIIVRSKFTIKGDFFNNYGEEVDSHNQFLRTAIEGAKEAFNKHMELATRKRIEEIEKDLASEDFK